MISESYPFVAQNRNKLYFFESTGTRTVWKAVQFVQMHGQVYNLGLADVENGKLQFRELTANEDSWKVLTTVAAIVLQFTEFYPQASVLIRAADHKRLRVYNLIFERRMEQIETLFEVFGILDVKADNAEPFVAGTFYEAFLIKRKDLGA